MVKSANYFVLLGPPGVGKGTQSNVISEKLDLPRVATGEIFRAHLSSESELGKIAKQYLHRGELVPDDVTNRMVRDYLKLPGYERGALLDGYPRTMGQAEALKAMCDEFDAKLAVAFIKVPEEELILRLAGRWNCPVDGRTYHLKFNPPKKKGVCDYDGAELFQREDDKPETVAHRIEVYFKETMPLLKYYDEKGLLVVVDGMKSIGEVSKDLLENLMVGESS
jgi:adenylate kinase